MFTLEIRLGLALRVVFLSGIWPSVVRIILLTACLLWGAQWHLQDILSSTYGSLEAGLTVFAGLSKISYLGILNTKSFSVIGKYVGSMVPRTSLPLGPYDLWKVALF